MLTVLQTEAYVFIQTPITLDELLKRPMLYNKQKAAFPRIMSRTLTPIE